MKEELIKIIDEFVAEVDKSNREHHTLDSKFFFEDDVELSFANFIQWLKFYE